MNPAVVIGERLARVLLLACTVLGIAALHTIGHSPAGGLDHHHSASASALLTVAATRVDVVAGDDGGCDGCGHRIVTPGATRDTQRWWEVCVAVLRARPIGVTAVGVAPHAHNAILWTTGTRHQPPPLTARFVPVGLALTTVAVLRT